MVTQLLLQCMNAMRNESNLVKFRLEFTRDREKSEKEKPMKLTSLCPNLQLDGFSFGKLWALMKAFHHLEVLS